MCWRARLARFAPWLAAALPWVMPAAAAGLDGVLPMPASPAYVKACGSCHTAYAPALLPARSWQRLMAELGQHFGEDASLEPALHGMLLDQLIALAGDGRHGVSQMQRHNQRLPPHVTPLRVTETPYFRFMHDEVPARVWRRAAIGVRSNCLACHARADEGRYFAREVRIPSEPGR